MLHLALLSDEEKTEFFQRAFSSEECTLHRFAPLELFTEREFYFLAFPLTPMNADAVVRLARSKTDKQKILLCSKIDSDALSLCQRLNIEVKTGEWVYALFNDQTERMPTDEPVQERKPSGDGAEHRPNADLVDPETMLKRPMQ